MTYFGNAPPRNWQQPASPHWKRPIAISRKSIARPSTPNSSSRPERKAQPKCRGSGAPWTTSSASSMSALWAMTTVCASKGSRCGSHRTGIAVTTSRRRCEYTVIQTAARPSFTAHASWPIMMLRVDSHRTLSRPSRKSAATGRPGEGGYGLYPLPLPRL